MGDKKSQKWNNYWSVKCSINSCYTTMETMEYEMARNMTLLFFLERLLDKGEPRTLHDLSCQFGAKGFTREMRQIAGGSQSGEFQYGCYYVIVPS